jgi:excisionase family DNA binding protein
MRNELPRQLERARTVLPEILTTTEVALELRCSKAHVHNLINGKVQGAIALPAVTLGRRRLVRRVSLEEWLRANEHTLG